MIKRGSSNHPYIYIGGITTTATTPTPTPETGQRPFCDSCSDWIVDSGWQDDGTYFCPTCLEFRKVDLMWRPDDGLVHDITENFT